MNKYTKANEILSFSDIHPEDHRFILSYIVELQGENQKLKGSLKEIKRYILKEMYVDREAVAGWLQFDNLLKMIERVDK